jgi:DNA invertase Pin-like site-specific DNA recombinase
MGWTASPATEEPDMTKRRLGVSYTRFSSAQQAQGDSQSRQDEMFRTFCTQHNLTPVKEVYHDRGLSGYKDEHRKKGKLGQLIAAAKDGRFEKDAVIVVEAWDRLGRLRPDKQTELVAELLRTGVSIGVCRLGEIFAEDDFGTHKWTTLAVFIQLAFQESKQKADRLAATWTRRRAAARENGGMRTKSGAASGKLPAWVEVAGGEARLIPERAAAVKLIFELAAAGLGHGRIVAELEKRGVRPFGEAAVNKGRSRPQFCGKWRRTYVALILRDRRAVGEVQYRTGGGKPDGPPLKLLPAAVTEEQYLLARAAAAPRKPGRGQGPRDRKHVNVFRGLLRHARDGEGMALHNYGMGKKPKLSLINASGVDGRGKIWTFPYRAFETAVLGLLKEVDPADVLPAATEQPSRADVLRAGLANVRADLAGLQQELRAGFSKTLAAVVREKEREEEAAAQELQDELARSVVPAERAWKDLPTLVDLVQTGGDEARLKLRGVLRRVVESIHVLIVPKGATRLCAVQVRFSERRDDHDRRDYLIAHRTAGYRRPERWEAKSFADAGAPDDYDLRRPADARALAKSLAASLQ